MRHSTPEGTRVAAWGREVTVSYEVSEGESEAFVTDDSGNRMHVRDQNLIHTLPLIEDLDDEGRRLYLGS